MPPPPRGGGGGGALLAEGVPPSSLGHLMHERGVGTRQAAYSLDEVPLKLVEGLVAALRPPAVVVDVAHHVRLVAEARVQPVPVPVALHGETGGGERRVSW